MKHGRNRAGLMAPFSVNISVTEKCPLKCPICFQPYNEKAELDINSVCSYLDELSLLGTNYVQFSGGEPLAYPYLSQVISYAKENGLMTRISTSGIGLTKEMVIQLKDVGLDYCHVSLNGSKACIHELTKDKFNETIEALRILSENNIPTAINWVANHENISDLPNLVNLAKKYNVQYISLLANKKNNDDKTLFPLTYNDLYVLEKYWEEDPDYLIIESCFFQLRTLIARKRKQRMENGCRAGRFYMAISARKEFSPCPHLRGKYEKGLSVAEYWKHDSELISIRHMMKFHSQASCQGCVSRRYCTACLNEVRTSDLKENMYKCLLYEKEKG